MITWLNCFSPKRYGVKNPPSDIRTEYERDWDRLVFSSAFRRLQNKTQVFPLPEEVFVHNRLTHSLEVASVGRSLGKIVGKGLIERNSEIDKNDAARRFYRNHLKNVIASACLAHDIGNPAFGHSGEEAISKYFKNRDTEYESDLLFKEKFSNEEWKDLTSFEGNANALRIMTMQAAGRFEGGFRLTYSTLGSIIKYPCSSEASTGSGGMIHRKKYGFFQIDKEVFLEVVDELNMVRDDSSEILVFKRHPFVLLVEAADDICYNLIDFEDAHRLGWLSYEIVREKFLEIASYGERNKEEDLIKQADLLKDDKNESLAYLRAKAIGNLTELCAKEFLDNEKDILVGNYNQALIEGISDLRNVLSEIERISIDHIYNARKVVELEIAGFRIMSSLIEDFVNAALKEKDERSKEDKKILRLIPAQFHFEDESSPYEKVMHILDYISGMTDLYALKLYRKMRGIEL